MKEKNIRNAPKDTVYKFTFHLNQTIKCNHDFLLRQNIKIKKAFFAQLKVFPRDA